MAPSRSKRQFANYEILSLVGTGEVSEVFQGTVAGGPRAGQLVALKRLRPELAADASCVEVFQLGSEAAGALVDGHIVRVLESGAVRNVYFAALEWIEGRTLSQLLTQCRDRKLPLPVDFALYIEKALLEALAVAHEAGQAHGGVNARSLFVDSHGEVKLGDFGWAAVRAAGRAAGLLASPAEPTPSVEADLWGATQLLHQLLTLQPAGDPEKPPPPVHQTRPDVPRTIEAVVDRGFSPLADERFSSARDFSQELEGLFDPNVGTPLGLVALMRALHPQMAPAKLAPRAPLPAASLARKSLATALAEDEPTEVVQSDEPIAPPPLPKSGARAEAVKPPPHPVKPPAAGKAPPSPPPGPPKDVEEQVSSILEAEGRFQRGEGLLRKGKYKAALKAFQDAVALHASEGMFHAYLGWALYKVDAKSARTALESIEKGVALNKGLDKGHVFAGYIHKEIGQKAEAQKEFEKAIQANPDNREALRELRRLGRS